MSLLVDEPELDGGRVEGWRGVGWEHLEGNV